MNWVAIRTAPNEPIHESWTEVPRAHGVAAYVRQATLRGDLGAVFARWCIVVLEPQAEEG